MRSPNPEREQTILAMGERLRELGFGHLGDAHTLGAAWFTLRLKGIGLRAVWDESARRTEGYEIDGAKRGSVAWKWAYESAPATYPAGRKVVRPLEREIASAQADPAPISREKLERIHHGIPTARRGRPSKRPDPALILQACQERGLEIPFERFLNANELVQLEQFATGATDQELAERWGLKEGSVRSRRSRLGGKAQQIVIRWRGSSETEEDVLNRETIIEAVREEGEKTRHVLTMAIYKAKDGETPAEAAERILAEDEEEA